MLEVRVLASPSIAPDTDEALFARAYSDGLPETFALLYDASLGAFTGTRHSVASRPRDSTWTSTRRRTCSDRV